MPDTILGLDIASSSIKAIQVTGGMKGYQLVACDQVLIAQGEGIEEGLKALSEKISFQGNICISSFQPDHVSFHNLQLPFKDKKKIAQTIGFELEPMLPFSVDTITTDYTITNHSGKSRILSASIRAETLEQYLNHLSTHNLDPEVVDISGAPTAVQFASQNNEGNDALFIDIGSDTSSLVLFMQGSVILVRAFPFGGHSMTRAISKAKEISRKEAEALKYGAETQQFAEVIKPGVKAFCQQIQNTLHAFRYEVMKEAAPKKVFLTGGGALYPGLPAMLSDFLELPVELFDLAKLTGLEIAENVSANWNPSLMNTALALALRDTKARGSFNFRIGRFAKEKKYEQIKKELKRIAVYALIVLVVLSGKFFTGYYVLQKHHEHYQNEIRAIFKKTLPNVKRIVDPVHQIKVKLREVRESRFLPAESLGRDAVVDLLRDIVLRIPKEASVDISRLIVDEKRVRLKGFTDTFNTVDEIKNGLKESDYFTEVSISSAQHDRSADRIRFELIME